MSTVLDIVEEIFDLYEKHGNEEYGESVTQLEHMSQCAQFAINGRYDEEIILAAFFHDIGHFLESSDNLSMGMFGIIDHEIIGSRYLLDKGFSKKIASLVASHVATKRYLTFVKPSYFLELSKASRNTLRYQGGPMNELEAYDFEQNEYFYLFLKIREWDDRAKIVGVPIENLDLIKDICRRHLSIGH